MYDAVAARRGIGTQSPSIGEPDHVLIASARTGDAAAIRELLSRLLLDVEPENFIDARETAYSVVSTTA